MREEKNIQNLGTIEGKLLFFGGVYSNLQALEALKIWADQNGFTPDKIFCTGDIVGYCAQPAECIEFIKEWGIYSIAGNVELQIRNGEDDCGCDFKDGGRCDLFSRNWYTYIQNNITQNSIDWLHTLPHHIQFHWQGKKIIIVHGSWFQTSDFIFRSTDWERKEENFSATGAEIIIAGHCGLPFTHVHEKKHWLNAGVIGMPANDGTDRVWFLTLEETVDKKVVFQFHFYNYNSSKASQLMLENGLPVTYAHTLCSGIWDNCEILPEAETAQQGKTISF